MNRETIYAALFSLVGGASAFKTKSRRLRAWADVPPDDQPAFFQVQRVETPQTVTGQPTRWLLEIDLAIYVNVGNDPHTAASQFLNPILDTITGLFIPNGASNVQTLGGLVHYARLSGQVQTDEGVLGAQAVAVIPIEILTAE